MHTGLPLYGSDHPAALIWGWALGSSDPPTHTHLTPSPLSSGRGPELIWAPAVCPTHPPDSFRLDTMAIPAWDVHASADRSCMHTAAVSWPCATQTPLSRVSAAHNVPWVILSIAQWQLLHRPSLGKQLASTVRIEGTAAIVSSCSSMIHIRHPHLVQPHFSWSPVTFSSHRVCTWELHHCIPCIISCTLTRKPSKIPKIYGSSGAPLALDPPKPPWQVISWGPWPPASTTNPCNTLTAYDHAYKDMDVSKGLYGIHGSTAGLYGRGCLRTPPV